MGRRVELQRILEKLLGSKNVHFQPPSSIKLKYPCIIYGRSPKHRRFANNKQYIGIDRYTLIVIDKNPDSEIPEKVMELPMVSMNQPYTKDTLNHYPFTIYY